MDCKDRELTAFHPFPRIVSRETAAMSQCASKHSPKLERDGRVACIWLCDADKRNALDACALEVLELRCKEARVLVEQHDVDVVVLRSEGAAFCAGFDLAACAEDPSRVAELLTRLSACVQEFRAIDAPLVARVQGAALAGGCALLTACDFVVVAADSQLGYPTHRIGISPAISIPTLFSRMGARARAMLMANELMNGRTALEHGLATHCVDRGEDLDAAVTTLVERLLAKGPLAMRATKQWMRRIEECDSGEFGRACGRDAGALTDARDASIALASGEEFANMLRAFWASRAKARE
jgi:methylglutaconyl-CoA hydratase